MSHGQPHTGNSQRRPQHRQSNTLDLMQTAQCKGKKCKHVTARRQAHPNPVRYVCTYTCTCTEQEQHRSNRLRICPSLLIVLSIVSWLMVMVAFCEPSHLDSVQPLTTCRAVFKAWRGRSLLLLACCSSSIDQLGLGHGLLLWHGLR